jgi:hypothetical protein
LISNSNTTQMLPPTQKNANGNNAKYDDDRSRKRERGECYSCGSTQHIKRYCPNNNARRSSSAKGLLCARCNGLNHSAAECRARMPGRASSTPAGDKLPLN